MKYIKIWDLPLRTFHWLLVVCVAGAYLCIKSAGVTDGWLSETGIDWMTWHSRFGYAVLSLILFRLLWGVVGPHYARFRQFVRGPSHILRYLRAPQWEAGHNPLGAWSVIAMLAAFGFQAFSGLFASDDILFEGPLSAMYPALSEKLNSWHHLSEWLLIILVILHVAAILYYSLFRRKPLVTAMIHGSVPAATPAQAISVETDDSLGTSVKALILFLLCIALVYWLTTLG